MLKFSIILTAVFPTIISFNYEEFQSKHCHKDKNVPTTAFYFPYKLPGKDTHLNGYVCENFVISNSDLESMSFQSFTLSNMENVFLKNCEIAYFNEILTAIFPRVERLFFENCKISLRIPENHFKPVNSNNINIIGFHKCEISGNSNSSALQKFDKLQSFLLQNTTLQYPRIDESFLPKINNLNSIFIDNSNVKSFYKGFLSTATSGYKYHITCTSSQLEELDSLFYEMNLKIFKFEFNFANNNLTKLPSMEMFARLSRPLILDLSGSRITEAVLTRNHFKSVTDLYHLDLSRNANITAIGKLAFADTILWKLNMSNVNLEFLEQLGCSNLVHIDFSYNGISDIGAEVFKDLSNLKYLNMSHNLIAKLDGNVFESLRSLRELRLNSNHLKEFSNDVFKSLIYLELLDITCNSVGEIELQNSSLQIINGVCNATEDITVGSNAEVLIKTRIANDDCPLISSNGLFAKHSATQEIVNAGGVIEEGKWYDYQCPPKHILLGAERDVCIDGELFSIANNNSPSCSKYCTSDVLKRTTTIAICKYEKSVIDCDDNILPGTTANFECQNGYIEPDVQISSITCLENGEWNSEPYPCAPVCGITPAPQKQFIYGSYTTTITNVPWQAAIYRMNAKGQYEHICGGSIVTAKLIVTAAHCLWDRTNNEKMDQSLLSIGVGKTRRDYYVEDTNFIPQFSNISDSRIGRYFESDSLSFLNDIAVLVLNTTIVFKNFIVPICWDRKSKFKDITSNVEGKIAGWGVDESGSPSPSLKFITLPSISNSECKTGVSEDYKSSVVADKFCVSSDNPGQSLCDGDSGGGFAVKRTNKYYLEGLVSTGLKSPNQECGSNFYVTMTNINHHIDLINDLEREFRVY